MARFFRKRSQMLGRRPGEAVYVGTEADLKTEIHEIRYSPENLELSRGMDSLEGDGSPAYTSWLNIDGLGDAVVLDRIKEKYSIPSLTMADILNTTLRPKADELEQGYFVSMKMLHYDQEKEMVSSEQIGILSAGQSVLTFQEKKGDVFDTVRKRLHDNIGRIRRESADYLSYSLMDAVVDNYIDIMQNLAERIESIEEDFLSFPNEKTLEYIIFQKKELLYLSKTIRPCRDAVKSLLKESRPLVDVQYASYFHDLLSNLIQVIESIDLYKEICSEYLNRYNSLMNDRLNDTMRFLTVFSVIFLPLSLLAGIYGMNFDHIPELHLKYGYLFFWILLLALSGGMVLIFKKKKWL